MFTSEYFFSVSVFKRSKLLSITQGLKIEYKSKIILIFFEPRRGPTVQGTVLFNLGYTTKRTHIKKTLDNTHAFILK